VFPALTFYSNWHTFENSIFLCMDFISINKFKFKTTQNIPSSRLVFVRGIFSQFPHDCENLGLYKFTEAYCLHYQDRRVSCIEINIRGRRNSRGIAFFRPKLSWVSGDTTEPRNTKQTILLSSPSEWQVPLRR